MSSRYAGWSRCPVGVPAVLLGLLLGGLLGGVLAACGGGDSSSPQAPTTASSPAADPTAATPDRAACRTQLATADTIARRGALLKLSLSDFQLRSNDMQEVVEEATHVCDPAVVAPLKASMLRLLAADDYLLTCSPGRTCRPGKLRKLLDEVVTLEHRAAARFS